MKKKYNFCLPAAHRSESIYLNLISFVIKEFVLHIGMGLRFGVVIIKVKKDEKWRNDTGKRGIKRNRSKERRTRRVKRTQRPVSYVRIDANTNCICMCEGRTPLFLKYNQYKRWRHIRKRERRKAVEWVLWILLVYAYMMSDKEETKKQRHPNFFAKLCKYS